MLKKQEDTTFVMLRKEAGLTQDDVAKALNVTRDTVANWENGRSTPKLEVWQFKELCKLLARPVEAIPDSFVSSKNENAQIV